MASSAVQNQKPPARQPTPEVGAKVEIIGEKGTYLVVRLDHQRYTADLMLMGLNAKMELGVHFACIRVLPDPRTTSYATTYKRFILESTEELK